MAAPNRDLTRKLEMFRANFRHLTSDGTYPPHRQQRLYQWCAKADLDWALACAAVAVEAGQLFARAVQQVVADGRVTPAEIASLQQLQRRLKLDRHYARPLETLYDLAEAKIGDLVLARAAYLSAAPAVASLRDEIVAYPLPAERQRRLLAMLDYQHALARLVAGDLPVVTPHVSLARGEVCHLEAEVAFTLAEGPQVRAGSGWLLVTSERVLVLSTTGGVQARWGEAIGFRYAGADTLDLTLGAQALVIQCANAQYAATLLLGARRRYAPEAVVSTPGNKRLPAI